MNRYKFRGKHNGEWVYGYYSSIPSDDGLMHLILPLGEICPLEVDPKTVGQWTGLNDKNGVEIYEGDIAVGEQSTYSIHWNERMAQFQAKIEQTKSVLTKHCSFPLWQYVKDGKCRFEVIGNIYEGGNAND